MSKLANAFPADKMVDLLKQLDDNVRFIVHTLRGKSAEVRRKVIVLLNKYLDLLADILRECMHFKNFIEILQRDLEGIEDILTLVLNGTVSEVLSDLRLEKYLPIFEGEDLEDAYQLMQANFDIEQVKLPTSGGGAKQKIRDRIQYYRRELMATKDRIHEVKEEGDKCYKSCQEITKKLTTFLTEINEVQEAIVTLLGDQRDEREQLAVLYMIAGGVALTCLVISISGAVGVGITFFKGQWAVASGRIAFSALTVGAGVLGAGAAATAWDINKQIKEVEKIQKALEELQKQLDTMNVEASKQKMAWRKIETQAEKIVHYIDNSKMEETAEGLQPSHRRLVQDVLHGVQTVLEDAATLQANVVQFEKEAQKVQGSLRDLSLMKESETDIVLAAPGGPPTSPLQPLYDWIIGLVKAMKTESDDPATLAATMAKSLKLE